MRRRLRGRFPGGHLPGASRPSLLSLAPTKPFFVLSFAVLEPKDFAARKISGRLYCTEKSLWKLNWFLRDFGYDTDLLGRDEVDEKALLGLAGVLRTTRKALAGRDFLNFDAFAPSTEWEFISKDARDGVLAGRLR